MLVYTAPLALGGVPVYASLTPQMNGRPYRIPGSVNPDPRLQRKRPEQLRLVMHLQGICLMRRILKPSMKEFFIADAPRFENQVITSYFCLSSIGVRDRKGGNGGQYLALTLADKTGQFEARMWEDFADVVEQAFVDRPPPRTSRRRRVDRVQQASAQLPSHEGRRRFPIGEIAAVDVRRDPILAAHQGQPSTRVVPDGGDAGLGLAVLTDQCLLCRERFVRCPACKAFLAGGSSCLPWYRTSQAVPS